MKVETTITIEADLLAQADRAAKGFQNRSEVFEKSLADIFADAESETAKAKTDARRRNRSSQPNRYRTARRDSGKSRISNRFVKRGGLWFGL